MNIRPYAVQAQATADTVMPHDDFFKARDELERRMGSFRAITSAFAVTTSYSAGKENILGFGVGLRSASGNLTDELAVKVFVRDKLPLARITSAAQVPP